MRSFTVVTGRERFKVIDEANGGVMFTDVKAEAYQYACKLVQVLRHPFTIEDRVNETWIKGGDFQEVRP